MLSINVPDSAWSEARMSLGGVQYRVVFRYNTRGQRWRMDIYDRDSVVIRGLKLMENQPLLQNHVLPNWVGGELYTLRLKDDGKPATRDNLGINEAYELIYFEESEL